MRRLKRGADELNSYLVLCSDTNRRDEVRIFTVPSILEQNQLVADYVGRFIVVMGLGCDVVGWRGDYQHDVGDGAPSDD